MLEKSMICYHKLLGYDKVYKGLLNVCWNSNIIDYRMDYSIINGNII